MGAGGAPGRFEGQNGRMVGDNRANRNLRQDGAQAAMYHYGGRNRAAWFGLKVSVGFTLVVTTQRRGR